MSDHTPEHDDERRIPGTDPVPGGPHFQVPAAPPVTERVGLGLAAAFVAVLLGIALTVIVWRLGFFASITSYALAAGAVFGYTKASGRTPRHGLVQLVTLIVVGVVASFFALVASDLWDIYPRVVTDPTAESRLQFLSDNVFRGNVIGSYVKEIVLFAIFAVLGVFSTLRRLMRSSASVSAAARG